MPEMDGYETMQAVREIPRVQAAADHLADREGDEGRPREVDRVGRVRLHHEARRHGSAPVADAGVAVPLDAMSAIRRRPRRRRRGRTHEELEQLEIELLLEAVYRRYGFDFREYAQASLKRRLWRRMHAEGARRRSRSCRTGCCTTRRAWSGCCSTSRSTSRRCSATRRSTSRSARRSCRRCARIRSRGSGAPAARPARRSTRSRSCCRRKGCTTGRASTRPTSTSTCSRRRARASSRSSKMKQYTQNYIRGGGKRRLLRVLRRRVRRRAVLAARCIENVVFAQHNLAMDRAFNEFNVILCRNVMIYFDKALQERVHGLFYDSLEHVRHPRARAQGVDRVHAVRRAATRRSTRPSASTAKIA